MFFTEKRNWERYAAIIFCIIAGCVAVWFGFKFLVPAILPFIIAALVGLIVRPAAKKLSKLTKIPSSIWGIVLMIVILGIIILVMTLFINRLWYEMMELANRIINDPDGGEFGSFIERMQDYIANLTANLPILRDLRAATDLEEFWNGVDDAARDALSNLASNITSKGSSMLGSLASALPSILVTILVTVIATFYACSGSVEKQYVSLIPEKARKRISAIMSKAKLAIVSWLRAYLLIMTLTFFELLIGLSILRVPYAFLIAAIIAVVDILPVLGTGTVLVPWAIISLLMKNYSLGIGILILYGLITIIRQILEPRIVGHSMGVPPLLTLISMYVGLSFFGFFGMIVGPAAVMMLLTVLRPKTESQTADGASPEAGDKPEKKKWYQIWNKSKNEKPTDEKPADEKPTDEKPADEKPKDEKPTDGKTK